MASQSSRPLPASFGDSIRQMPDFRDRASRHPQLGPAAATVALHPVAAPVCGGRSHDVKKEENLCVDRCGSCVWCTRDTHRENERCGQGEEDCPDLERTARLGFPPSVRAGRRSRAARRAFIGALLDVTDNVNAAGAIVPPQAVVRRDGDDPYPVRTRAPRRCPDIANDGAAEHDFWLGDALVSRAGHDHKEMGITAKGERQPTGDPDRRA